MMTEISLNILDAAENSARADALLISILVWVDTGNDRLTTVITDDGCGMTKDELTKVMDPFFTTRKTRKVGLGIPFFKYAAECTGGTFTIQSKPGCGTTITAVFGLSHIDRMPLGNINGTIETLITCHPDKDFLYTYRYNESSFELDTRNFRKILGDIPFDEPEISSFIKEYLRENKSETDGDAAI
jgi:anti-sigma regulatory factor (Ser/Thr protein kinase)